MGEEEEAPRGEAGKTSYGIGVRYIQPPPPLTGISKDRPLRPILYLRSQVSPGHHFSTTSASEHAGRPQDASQVQTRYPKAPPHWKIDRLGDLATQLRGSPSVRPLSTPVSEARDNYRGLPRPKTPRVEDYSRLQMPRRLHDRMPCSLVPLVSTSHTHHRPFNRQFLTTDLSSTLFTALLAPSYLLSNTSTPSFYSMELRTTTPPERPPSHLRLLRSSTLFQPPPQKTPPTDTMSSHLHHCHRPLVRLPFAGRSSEYMEQYAPPPPMSAPAGPRATVLPSWEFTVGGVGTCRPRGGHGGPGTGNGAEFRTPKHNLEVLKMYKPENSTQGDKRVA